MPATSTVSSPDSIRTVTSSVKSSETASLDLDQLDAALLGQGRRVDQVDLLLGVAREDPDQHRDAEQAGVVLGDAAAELGRRPGR